MKYVYWLFAMSSSSISLSVRVAGLWFEYIQHLTDFVAYGFPSLVAQMVKLSACNAGDPGSILSSLWKKFLWMCRAPETLSKKLSVPSWVWSCFFGVGSSTAICHWWSFFFSFGEQEGEDTAWVKQRTKNNL